MLNPWSVMVLGIGVLGVSFTNNSPFVICFVPSAYKSTGSIRHSVYCLMRSSARLRKLLPFNSLRNIQEEASIGK